MVSAIPRLIGAKKRKRLIPKCGTKAHTGTLLPPNAHARATRHLRLQRSLLEKSVYELTFIPQIDSRKSSDFSPF
jgi:hypothetical protein